MLELMEFEYIYCWKISWESSVWPGVARAIVYRFLGGRSTLDIFKILRLLYRLLCLLL